MGPRVRIAGMMSPVLKSGWNVSWFRERRIKGVSTKPKCPVKKLLAWLRS